MDSNGSAVVESWQFILDTEAARNKDEDAE